MLFTLNFNSLNDILEKNISTDTMFNEHIKLLSYILLNGSKSVYMQKKIKNINKQISIIYEQFHDYEYNNNMFELYILIVPSLVLSIYISIEMFFIFYAFNKIISQLPIITFLLINLIKFYNVYELCIYWNYLMVLI